MKELGIEVSIKGASWDEICRKPASAYRSIRWWGWGTNAPTEMIYIQPVLPARGTGNYACYTSEPPTSTSTRRRYQPTVKSRSDLWKKAQWDG